jgi:hypothetical protein
MSSLFESFRIVTNQKQLCGVLRTVRFFLGFYTWAYFPGCAASSSDVLRVIIVISNSALGFSTAASLF